MDHEFSQRIDTNLTMSGRTSIITISPTSIDGHIKETHNVCRTKRKKTKKKKTSRLTDLSLSKDNQKTQTEWCHNRFPAVMRIKGKVGPHIDVYELFHSDCLRHELSTASAIKIQRAFRRWIAGRKLAMLKDKIDAELPENVSYWSFADDYSSLMRRVLKRHGVGKHRLSFKIDNAKKFLDKQKNFSEIFHSMSADNRLDRDQIKEFFRRVNMFPSQSEIDAAAKLVFTGCSGRGEIVFALDAVPAYSQYRAQQSFVKDLLRLLDCIHEGATRIGYVSVSSEESRSFDLSAFKQAEEICKAMDQLRHSDPSVSQLHTTVARMREMLLKGRPDVPLIGVVFLSDERASHLSTVVAQCRQAKLDNINIMAIGGVKLAKDGCLKSFTSRDDWVFKMSVEGSVRRLRKEISNLLCAGDCPYCRYQAGKKTPYSRIDKSRIHDQDKGDEDESMRKERIGGLDLNELMEIVWTLYPPDGVDVAPLRRSTWLRPIIRDNEVQSSRAGEGRSIKGMRLTPELAKCLRLVFRARLEREGVLHVPVGTGTDVWNLTDVETAIQLTREYMKEDE